MTSSKVKKKDSSGRTAVSLVLAPINRQGRKKIMKTHRFMVIFLPYLVLDEIFPPPFKKGGLREDFFILLNLP
jgi:hypothetical protein